MSSPGPGRRCWAARRSTACWRSRPRAVARLESYTPPWPMPKLFRMTKGGKLIEGIFAGETINTPSMLAVEDALDGLRWAEAIGGLPALIGRGRGQPRGDRSAGWRRRPGSISSPRIRATRSRTSVCLKIVDPWLPGAAADRQAAVAKRIAGLLEQEGAGYDVGVLPRRAAGPAPLGRRHRRDRRSRRRCSPGSTGPGPASTAELAGRLSSAAQPAEPAPRPSPARGDGARCER